MKKKMLAVFLIATLYLAGCQNSVRTDTQVATPKPTESLKKDKNETDASYFIYRFFGGSGIYVTGVTENAPKNIVVPENVYEIGPGVFENCENLKSVTILGMSKFVVKLIDVNYILESC